VYRIGRREGSVFESRRAGASGGEGRGGSEEEGRGEKGASMKENQEEKEKLLRVQTQPSTIQPLWMGRTHAAWGNPGAAKTAMSGTKNGNANANAHKATNHGVWFVSFSI